MGTPRKIGYGLYQMEKQKEERKRMKEEREQRKEDRK